MALATIPIINNETAETPMYEIIFICFIYRTKEIGNNKTPMMQRMNIRPFVILK